MFHIILYCLLLNKDKDGAKKNNFVSVGCVITDKWSTIEHISCVRINHLQYNECYIDDMKGKTEKWWLLRWKQHFIFEELYGERFSGTNLPSGIRFLFSNLGFELRDRGSLSSFSFVSSSRFICVAMCIFFLHLIQLFVHILSWCYMNVKSSKAPRAKIQEPELLNVSLLVLSSLDVEKELLC